MRSTKRNSRVRAGRLLAAAAIATSICIGSATLTSAAPSQADLQSAKAKLSELNRQMSILDEQYNQAQLKLQQTQAALSQAKTDVQNAKAEITRLRAQLSAQAAQAYESQGSAISVLLGSSSFSQLSDRVEFLQTIAQNNTDTATKAQVAEQQFRDASSRLNAALKQRQAVVATIASKRSQLQAGVSQTQRLISTIQGSLKRQAAAAAIAAAQSGGSSSPIGDPGSILPPSAGAAAAVSAAKAALGVPYVFGGASMSGFDCSGLTMWAWQHAGVYLPHSAAAQYASIPHVARSDLQPGDLLFFYNPIGHVAMYVGGGEEIAASHTGTVVSYYPVDWPNFVGAGRP